MYERIYGDGATWILDPDNNDIYLEKNKASWECLKHIKVCTMCCSAEKEEWWHWKVREAQERDVTSVKNVCSSAFSGSVGTWRSLERWGQTPPTLLSASNDGDVCAASFKTASHAVLMSQMLLLIPKQDTLHASTDKDHIFRNFILCTCLLPLCCYAKLTGICSAVSRCSGMVLRWFEICSSCAKASQSWAVLWISGQCSLVWKVYQQHELLHQFCQSRMVHNIVLAGLKLWISYSYCPLWKWAGLEAATFCSIQGSYSTVKLCSRLKNETL